MSANPKRDYSPGVRAARVLLNACIEHGGGVLSPADARDALKALETQATAVGALGVIVMNPGNREALEHARRAYALCTKPFTFMPPAPSAGGVDDLV